MARSFARFVLPLAMALLAGCTVGPKYVKPSAPTAPAFKELGAPNVVEGAWKQAQPSDQAARGKWWEAFNDPDLNRLEEKLSISNQNIVAAVANVQSARAMIREARSQYFPTLGVNPSITNMHLSNGFGQTFSATFNVYTLPLEASWEPDLWGRVRNTVKANTFAAQGAAADLENVRLSAQADLAADYYELRAQDTLKQLLDSTVRAYGEALELTNVVYKSGLGNDEAVAQAETQWKGAQAQDTDLGVLRAQYEHAIAVLAGLPPSELSIPTKVLFLTPPTVPVGLPSQLLERRPDIASAERAVAAANAQIGIAKAAFFPDITLGASAGLSSIAIARWFEWPSRVWSVGPSLTQTIFDAGLRRATVQQYQAVYDQTVASYRQTVLTAFQQVEDNLAALRILDRVVEQQRGAVDSAGRNLEEAEVRYRAGVDPYLNVITAQTALLSNQQAVVNFRSQQMIAAVNLIKALGGGWDASRLPSAQELGSAPRAASGIAR